MRARHRRAPVAKARYYGLASGGANQLPAAAARAFTPSPDRPPGPRPSTELLISSRRCDPGTLPPDVRPQCECAATFCRASMRHACPFCIFRNKKEVKICRATVACGTLIENWMNYHGVAVWIIKRIFPRYLFVRCLNEINAHLNMGHTFLLHLICYITYMCMCMIENIKNT